MNVQHSELLQDAIRLFLGWLSLSLAPAFRPG